MSSQKLTLTDIISKWKELVTGSGTNRWEEMEAFFCDVAEAEITPNECMKNKERILKVWVDMTWQDAQKNNPTWREKSYWKARKDATLKTWDKWYTEYKKTVTPEEAKKPAPPAPVEDEDASPIFDNVEDFKAWKQKNRKMG